MYVKRLCQPRRLTQVDTVGDDAEDAKFFSIDDMPEITLESHKKLIEDFLALKGLSATI